MQVTPKFSKQYAAVGVAIQAALSAYREEVTSRKFPSPEHTPYRIGGGSETARFIAQLRERGLNEAAERALEAAQQDEVVGEPRIKTPID